MYCRVRGGGQPTAGSGTRDRGRCTHRDHTDVMVLAIDTTLLYMYARTSLPECFSLVGIAGQGKGVPYGHRGIGSAGLTEAEGWMFRD